MDAFPFANLRVPDRIGFVAAAFVALFRYRIGIMSVVGGAALAGLAVAFAKLLA